MLLQIGNASHQRFSVPTSQPCWERLARLDHPSASMQLEGPERDHDHGCIRIASRHTALDVEELLRSEFATESGLGDDIVRTPQRNRISQD